MTLHRARICLLGIWLLGTAVLMVLTIPGSFTDRYGTAWQDHLLGASWYAPLVVPTVLMMLAVTPLTPRPDHTERLKSLGLFMYAVFASLIYFGFLFFVPLSDVYLKVMNIQDLFRLSAVLFVPLQTMVVVLIGKIFFAGA
jgi:hypothetical protein